MNYRGDTPMSTKLANGSLDGKIPFDITYQDAEFLKKCSEISTSRFLEVIL
jgi:hypothetical protein